MMRGNIFPTHHKKRWKKKTRLTLLEFAEEQLDVGAITGDPVDSLGIETLVLDELHTLLEEKWYSIGLALCKVLDQGEGCLTRHCRCCWAFSLLDRLLLQLLLLSLLLPFLLLFRVFLQLLLLQSSLLQLLVFLCFLLVPLPRQLVAILLCQDSKLKKKIDEKELNCC